MRIQLFCYTIKSSLEPSLKHQYHVTLLPRMFIKHSNGEFEFLVCAWHRLIANMYWIPVLLLIVTTYAAGPKGIVLIIADDLGSADVSYRYTDPTLAPISTPNIDKLANDGVKLTSYYTHPLCGPSRSALISARYQVRIGNPFSVTNGFGSLHANYSTLPRHLSNRGFRNHYVGKWGIDGDIAKGTPVGPGTGFGPLQRGFHSFYGMLGSSHHHYTKRELFGSGIDLHDWRVDGTRLSYPELDHEEDVHSTDLFTRVAINRLDEHFQDHKDDPFFLVVSYTAPHDPLVAAPRHRESQSCKHMQSWRRKEYCALVGGLDEGIENLTDALERHGVLDDVVMVFTTDNGGQPFAGGLNYPYRGGKASTWEGATRGPAFIRAPKFLNNRTGDYDGLVHIVDWAPTFLGIVDRQGSTHLDSVGAHEMGDIDGIDMTDAFSFGDDSVRSEVFVNYDILFNSCAIITTVEDGSRMKLVLGSSGKPTVYNEPKGRWILGGSSIDSKVTEVLIDLLHVLYQNSIVLQYTLYGMVAMANDILDGTSHFNFAPRILALTQGMVNSNQTLPIIHPHPEWSTLLKTERGPRIHLYNLTSDPFENHNLALEGTNASVDMINFLTSRMLLITNDSPEQFSTVIYRLTALNLNVMQFTVVLVLSSVFVIYRSTVSLYRALMRGESSMKLKSE